VSYCSRACQVDGWPAHKAFCARLRKQGKLCGKAVKAARVEPVTQMSDEELEIAELENALEKERAKEGEIDEEIEILKNELEKERELARRGGAVQVECASLPTAWKKRIVSNLSFEPIYEVISWIQNWLSNGQTQLVPLHRGKSGDGEGFSRGRMPSAGGAVQVESTSLPVALKAAWFQPLNPSSEKLVSSLCFHMQLVPLHTARQEASGRGQGGPTDPRKRPPPK
jgi:hypothetical protein